MRRLAFLSFHTCPLARLGTYDAGGLNVYVHRLACALYDRGWQVDIFTRAHPGCRQVIQHERGVRIIHLPVAASVPKGKLLPYTGAFARSIVRYTKKEEGAYDLIHSHYYLSAKAGLEVAKRLSVPHVVTFHTLGKLKQLVGEKVEAARIAVEKRLMSEATGVIASTPLEERELVYGYGGEKKKIWVAPPGVDEILFRPRPREKAKRRLRLGEKKIILFVGRIDTIKGISTLLEAVALLHNRKSVEHGTAKVLLVGGDTASRKFWETDEVKRIQKIIKAKDLGCCVSFLGAKPHSELPWYYSAANVVVLPSLYETFGLVVLEAMACGAAVVASRVGGLPYLVEDRKTGLLFRSQNAADLAQKISYLLSHEEVVRKLAAAATAFARRQTWHNQAKKISDIYRRIFR